MNEAVSRSEARRLVQVLPPGSDQAISKGCTCPVLDNGHGNEELGRTRGFWMSEDCPLHGLEKKFSAS